MRKSWYLLPGLLLLLILALVSFAAFMTYEASRQLCADGHSGCSMPGLRESPAP